MAEESGAAPQAERAPGFYWIRAKQLFATEHNWGVAQWVVPRNCEAYWTVYPEDPGFRDEDFAEIGERVERRRPDSFFVEHLELAKADLAQPDWLREATLRNWRDIIDTQKIGEFTTELSITSVRSLLEAMGKTVTIQGWPQPQPITKAQKTGEKWLVWRKFTHRAIGMYSGLGGWYVAFWMNEEVVKDAADGHPIHGYWCVSSPTFHTPIGDDTNVTRCLPLPPGVGND